MTITNQQRVQVYEGNGVSRSFPWGFIIPSAGALVVEKVATDGTKTVIGDSEYAATGFGDSDGGTVTYPRTPTDPALQTGEQIIISRVVAYTQELSLNNQTSFLPEVLEDQLDLTTMGLQQLADDTARSIKASEGEVFDQSLPPKTDLAGRVLGFDTVTGEPEAVTVAIDSVTGGLNEAQVDARVRAGVEDWAEEGNADIVPEAKLPDIWLDQDEVDARVQLGVRSSVEDWAEVGNAVVIPEAKLTNAPVVVKPDVNFSGDANHTITEADFGNFNRLLNLGSLTQNSATWAFPTTTLSLAAVPVGSTLQIATLQDFNYRFTITSPGNVVLNGELPGSLTFPGFAYIYITRVGTNVYSLYSDDSDDAGLTQAQVDARVRVGVEDWAEEGNTDAIPAAKLTEAPGQENVPVTLTLRYTVGNQGAGIQGVYFGRGTGPFTLGFTALSAEQQEIIDTWLRVGDVLNFNQPGIASTRVVINSRTGTNTYNASAFGTPIALREAANAIITFRGAGVTAVEDWAQEGNIDAIPEAKLTNAPKVLKPVAEHAGQTDHTITPTDFTSINTLLEVPAGARNSATWTFPGANFSFDDVPVGTTLSIITPPNPDYELTISTPANIFLDGAVSQSLTIGPNANIVLKRIAMSRYVSGQSGASGGGLDPAEVDARIADWAETGNTEAIPEGKLTEVFPIESYDFLSGTNPANSHRIVIDATPSGQSILYDITLTYPADTVFAASIARDLKEKSVFLIDNITQSQRAQCQVRSILDNLYAIQVLAGTLLEPSSTDTYTITPQVNTEGIERWAFINNDTSIPADKLNLVPVEDWAKTATLDLIPEAKLLNAPVEPWADSSIANQPQIPATNLGMIEDWAKVGFRTEVPQNKIAFKTAIDQLTAKRLTLSDFYTVLNCTNAAAPKTITIPADPFPNPPGVTYPQGTSFTIINESGPPLTLSPEAGVMLNGSADDITTSAQIIHLTVLSRNSWVLYAPLAPDPTGITTGTGFQGDFPISNVPQIDIDLVAGARAHKFLIRGLSIVQNGFQFVVRGRSASPTSSFGATWDSSLFGRSSDGSALTFQRNADTNGYLGTGISNTTERSINGEITVLSAGEDDTRPSYTGLITYLGSNNRRRYGTVMGTIVNSNRLYSLRFHGAGGNLRDGTISYYTE